MKNRIILLMELGGLINVRVSITSVVNATVFAC